MEGKQLQSEPWYGPDEAPIDLRAYLAILLKRKWIIAVVFVATLAATALYTLRQTPIYAAGATVVIDLEPPQVLGEGVREAVDIGAGYYYSNTKDFFETQYKIIASRRTAELAAEKLGLDKDSGFLGLTHLPADQQAQFLTLKAAASAIQGRTSVEPVKDSRVVRIRVEDEDPGRAAAIANELARAYMQSNLERRVEGSRDASVWLQKQLADLKGSLVQSEVALHEFKKQNDLIQTSFENRQTVTNQRVLALNDNLTRVLARKAEVEARVETIRAERKSADIDRLMELGPVAESGFVSQLKMSFLAVTNEAGDLRNRYGPEHPKLKAAEEKLAHARENLLREIDRILGAQIAEYDELVATERKLKGLLETAKREALKVNEKEIEYRRLAREEENNQRIHDLVLKRVKEVDLSAMLQANNVRLLDEAEPNPWPIKPRTRSNLALGAILGLFAGIGLAFLLEFQDRSVKSHLDLEALGLNFLGVVPPIKPKRGEEPGAKETMVYIEPKSAVAECCRTIRSNLLFLNPDTPWRTMVVTSAGPQEGKTTVLANLGIALAQGGNRVLLVDSDMRRSRLHKVFGLPNELGLSGLIAKGGEIDDAVKSSEVPGLFVLPAGPVPPNPAELLHSERFRTLVQALSAKFDKVIFDSPPVTAVADPLVLANVLDGTLVVTKAFFTDREVAERTVKSLRDANAKLLGAVLNALDGDDQRYRYKIGYYYKYGQSYVEETSASSKA